MILHTSRDLPKAARFDRWCTIGGAAGAKGGKVGSLADRLEAAFDAIRDRWWELGRALAATPSAELAHMPTCGTYSSDFGLMLAWAKLVGELAAETPRSLVVCDDPWLFRHLATLPGVAAGPAPGLFGKDLALRLRGLLARCRAAARVARASLAGRRLATTGGPAIVVFGHPESDAGGTDAYFGGLMGEIPQLKRLMHTDCPIATAGALEAGGRTASLHAWGNPWLALVLPFARWRPSRADVSMAEEWLVRRAAALEGGGGSGAMTRWQLHCQERWLDAARPSAVAWPWENHPWERVLVRMARRRGIRTVGHQHTVIGPHMYNQSPASNADGIDGLPDLIVCNGPAYARNLADWGVPEERLAIGGALRQAGPRLLAHDPGGPVFVALSANRSFSAQMLAALRRQGGQRRFLIKEHPMFPIDFEETEALRRTETPLPGHDGLSGVLYSTGTVGLEALLGGLPTLRFRPEGAVAMNILPPGLEARNVDAETLGPALENLEKQEVPAWDTVLAKVDPEVWKQALT